MSVLVPLDTNRLKSVATSHRVKFSLSFSSPHFGARAILSGHREKEREREREKGGERERESLWCELKIEAVL